MQIITIDETTAEAELDLLALHFDGLWQSGIIVDSPVIMDYDAAVLRGGF